MEAETESCNIGTFPTSVANLGFLAHNGNGNGNNLNKMASSQTSIATALTNPIVDNIALKINSEDSVQGCMCLSLNYLQFISKRKAFKDLQVGRGG